MRQSRYIGVGKFNDRKKIGSGRVEKPINEMAGNS
jgi:hypothetical protein